MGKKIIISLVMLLSLFIYGLPVTAEERKLEDEIIYEIIVDRYNNGDYSIDEKVDLEDPVSYHGGDLNGITKRLDENVEIGVTMLALSPIMSNMENGFHGYWVDDFTAIEEQFGTFEDLEELVTEAHARDIKIVLEFVTNYIPADHPIAQDPDRADWILTDDVSGPEWTDNVVQLNQDHPEVQEFLIDAAGFWLDETSIDGLVFHAVDQSSLDFLTKLTNELKERHPDRYLLGDVLDAEADISGVVDNTALDAVDNYSLGKAISDVLSAPDQSPAAIYEAHEQALDNQSLVFVDDKYSKRFTQKLSENGRNSVTTWRLVLAYMYTTPGVPVLLQGSEVSMYGETAEDSQRLVPFNSGEPELKEYHDRISSLRNQFPALKYGDFELVDARDSFAVFKRTYEDQTMYIAINNGSESSYVDVTDIDPDQMLRGYLEDNTVRVNEEGNHRIGIPRESVEVYEVVDHQGFNWIFISFVIGIMAIFIFGVISLVRKQKQREKEDVQANIEK